MAGPARVHSIQALRDFRASLIMFADAARSALDTAQSELNRSATRLNHELPTHWKAAQRRWEEEVVRARIALEHALSQAEMGKSSIDERKSLAHAKDRVAEARAKLGATKKWSREVERERTLYRGQVEPLARVVESVIPNALYRLERMGEDLDQYTRVASPDASHTAASTERAMANAVASPNADASDQYAALRAMLPSADTIRDAQHEDAPADVPAITLEREDRAVLALAAGHHPGADLRLELSLARATEWGTRIVLQRGEAADASDSGWYVHTEEHCNEWVRTPCLRLLASCPDFASISRLPPGSTVIIDQGGVSALFDTIGQDVWETMRSPRSPRKEDDS